MSVVLLANNLPVTLYSFLQKFWVLVLDLKLQWPCIMSCQMTCRERSVRWKRHACQGALCELYLDSSYCWSGIVYLTSSCCMLN